MAQWMVAAKKADFQDIGKKFQIDQVTARLIRNRDVMGDENIRIYLQGSLSDLPDPHQMKDMDRLVEILVAKIEKKEKIRIIGDYDADGVMSSYILHRALKRMGADVDVVIPHRIYDGYGLNLHLIEQAISEGVDTLLTCDNGIAALDEIAYAKQKGMTVLVTDHHAIPFEDREGRHIEKKSAADAVVNPHQSECSYPYKELCGAGVAWNVIRVLYENRGIPGKEADDLLEFVALATVCDVMSLTGVNRILVKEGLKRIHHTKNIGMQALIAACGMHPADISAYHFGFVLGPCVNATGRLDTARNALKLFQTEDEGGARDTAEMLVALNEERKAMTVAGVEQAQKMIAAGNYEKDPILVVFLPDVHESIAGLIAGRLRESYGRPVFVLTRGEEGVKGSGRSTEEYSMYEEMCKCSDLFTRFGGHPMAAGLSLPEENVTAFRKRINQICSYTVAELEPRLHIDMQMPVGYVTTELVTEFSCLAPFGKDNTKPLFADKNLRVRRMWVVGKNRNVLRLQMVSAYGECISVVYFGDISRLQSYLTEKFGKSEVDAAMLGRENGILLSMVYEPKIDTYRDNESLQFEMKDYR